MELLRKLGLPSMNLVRFKDLPILKQLHLEEKLLRSSSENWCIINDGTSAPAIVMGISGKAAELVEIELVLRNRIPVIRRFTGGGTVIVDGGTVFVSLICNKDDVHGVQPFPRSIMSWTGLLYGEVFQGVDDFQLRENDYVVGDRKFGGNAQSITKNRWIHHTSFLWDYDTKNMAYLKKPSRAPQYRLARDHTEFICRMKDHVRRPVFIHRTLKCLQTHFSVKQIDLEADGLVDDSGRFAYSTSVLTDQQLKDAFDSSIQNQSNALTG